MRKTLRWLGLITLMLVTLACSQQSVSPPPPAAQFAATTAIAGATPTPAPTVTPAPTATTPPGTPKPAATAAPTVAPTPNPNATWVPLNAIDQDLSHGLLRETDLDKTWSKQDAVDHTFVMALNQINCDGAQLTEPVPPQRSAEIAYQRDAGYLPEPLLIQLNWALPSDDAADTDMDFIKQALRCSNWENASPGAAVGSVDIRSYDLAKLGDDSVAARMNISLNGTALVLTSAYVRSGSVITNVVYVDTKPADPKEFEALAKKAIQRAASLHL